MKKILFLTVLSSPFFLIGQIINNENIIPSLSSNSDSYEFIQVNSSKHSSSGINDKAAPSNDNCASATSLTIGAALTCGTTLDAGLQGGECYTNYGGGVTNTTVWYSFVATNDSAAFAFNKTNNTNVTSPHVRIFGANVGCLPACGSEIYNALHNGDPGVHTLLTGLTVGATYLIQVQGTHKNGSGDAHTEFCLGVFNPATNNIASGSDGIDQCGVVYNGTNTGYSAEDLTLGSDNLDGNLATTCPTCVTAGDDVPYVVNNSSWFSFCATTAGTWNIDFAGITNCVNLGPNFGLQMTIFRGTANNLTVIGHAPSPSVPASTWTSANFSVAAGECIFLVVDGFAGDQCDYSYTLNNLTGGCNLLPLPVNLLAFTAILDKNNAVNLEWATATEINNDFFTIEKSKDGKIFEVVEIVNAAGNSNDINKYGLEDDSPYGGTSYYRLKQTDFDGAYDYSNIVPVNLASKFNEVNVYPNPVTNNGHLTFTADRNGQFDVSIYDVTGRNVLNQSYTVEEGVNNIELPTSNLKQGMYFIYLGNDTEQTNIKFIKD